MKRLTLVLGSICALALAGCYGNSTPENTIKSAAYALKKGKPNDFNKLLSGKALEKFGTQKAFAKLQAKFNVKPEPKILDADQLDQWSKGTATFKSWQALVGTDDGSFKMTLDLTCKTDWEWRQVEVCHEHGGHGHGHGHNGHRECHYEQQRVRAQHCSITDAK